MLEIQGIWLRHMSRWDRYVLRPRIWMETSRSGTVLHIGHLQVPMELVEHKLHIRPGSKPFKQPLRRFSEDKRRAIGEEIAKLLAAGFIMEVFYPDWLGNPVTVMKKNKTWRMCIDYTCLNKVCPKDPFALPRIDQVIDSTAGCELLSFLDATAGYHQIKLAVEDQIKTT